MNILETLKIGDKAPDEFLSLIEIPKGSHNKYEFDDELGVFTLNRVLYSPMHYPLDYGLIPETLSEDGDHLDVLIIGGDPVPQGCVVATRPIGVLKMIDDGDEDYKILGVQIKNPRLNNITDIKHIESYNPHLLKEVSHFFTVYKDLEDKSVEISSWEGVDVAKSEIERAHKTHKDKIDASS